MGKLGVGIGSEKEGKSGTFGTLIPALTATLGRDDEGLFGKEGKDGSEGVGKLGVGIGKAGSGRAGMGGGLRPALKATLGNETVGRAGSVGSDGSDGTGKLGSGMGSSPSGITNLKANTVTSFKSPLIVTVRFGI